MKKGIKIKLLNIIRVRVNLIQKNTYLKIIIHAKKIIAHFPDCILGQSFSSILMLMKGPAGQLL